MLRRRLPLPTPSAPARRRSRVRRTLAAMALAVGVAALVAALGAALVAAPASAQTTGGGFVGPGGSGTLVARNGSTLQIEAFTGTTSKVIVTGSTEYRQVEDTDSTAITKGACVQVNGEGSTAEGIDATTVEVVDADQCASPRAAAGGGRPGGFPGGGQIPNGGTLPDGGSLPSGGPLPNGGSLPNGGTFPQGGTPPSGDVVGAGGNVTGKVVSVDGDAVVVRGRVPQQSSNGDLKLEKRKVTVTLSDATTVTHTVDATERALVVGSCVRTQGSTDSVGTVTADTVTVSQPVDGACTAGFGGRGFVPPGGATANGAV